MITLNNVSLRRGAKLLLDKATVTLNPGEKVGLVGRNGAGKSTLFALLNGSLHEDGGDFSIPKVWRMAQVAQNMPETDETATDFVIAGDTRLIELRQMLAAAELAEDGMAMAHAHADLADAGEHDAISRAQSLILGLGFKVSELDQSVNSFSGGWRMRLQLARALMCPSDLLLLDEPTNHLDLDALVWLEAWLKRYPGTMIVISHDREFLDAVTNVTLHIEHAKLNRYGGNYSSFETMRAQQLELQQASFAKQQEKIAHLQKFITRFKAKASKAKQAQSRVKALERMEKIAPVLADAEFTFEFKEPQNLPNPMLAISDASFGYQVDGGNKIIIKDVNKSVLAGQRIGILGANGQGKSTLVKTIARTMPQLAGVVTEGKGLNVGYFAQQELDVLRSEDNPLEHMIRLAKDLGPNAAESGKEQDLRNFLGTFNFAGDMVKQAVGTMSGGEKARLVLAMIVWQRPNLLLLDEPTNHLDLATREALSMALNEFEGTVMLVSHDRALLRAVCDEFWLVGRGEIKPFDGDLDDYQQYLLDESKRLREEAKVTSEVVHVATIEVDQAKPVVKSSEQKKLEAARRQEMNALTKPIKKKVEKAEKDMADLNRQKLDIETQLSQPITPAEIAQLGKNLKSINDQLAVIEEEWLGWVANIDEIEASFN
ncbi:MAG: ABC-F family ATP-binding cassette domain-containing protein [Polynucleobacter sp.]